MQEWTEVNLSRDTKPIKLIDFVIDVKRQTEGGKKLKNGFWL